MSVLFSEHAQYPGRSTARGGERGEGGGGGRGGWGGGFLCFQGDGNTRLYTATAVLCNRAVTMAMFKGLG